MEKSDSTEEKNMRLNFKQTAKGIYYAEWTIRANTIEELKARNEQVRDYALEELKKLN